jgi:tRNA A-37 threonylcarbamoyl transferase component Bud32
LAEVHKLGVAHGDVELRNFVCHEGVVRVLDFGMCMFREEVATEPQWQAVVNEEMECLEELLKEVTVPDFLMDKAELQQHSAKRSFTEAGLEGGEDSRMRR